MKLVIVFWNSKLWKTCDMGILLDRHFFAPIQKLESKTGALMAWTDQKRHGKWQRNWIVYCPQNVCFMLC